MKLMLGCMVIWLIFGMISLLFIIIEHIVKHGKVNNMEIGDIPSVILILVLGPIPLWFMVKEYLDNTGNVDNG